MLKEFKEFAMRGSIIDLAVGVIIGGAFQKIVTSLVEDIIMPLISVITGGVSFSDWVWVIGQGEDAPQVNYGLFLSAILDFIIIAFSIFLIVKYINKLNKKLSELKEKELEKLAAEGKIKRRKTDTPNDGPTTKICPYCYSEINIQASRCPHCTSELENDEQ